MKKKHLTLKIFLFLVFLDLLETFAQFCFKKSVSLLNGFEIKKLADFFHFIVSVIPSPYLWIGIFSVIVIFSIWSTILSKIDLSVAVPVSSFSYITIPLVSLFFLHEKISSLRWTGIFIILFGVILVSISSKHKEESGAPRPRQLRWQGRGSLPSRKTNIAFIPWAKARGFLRGIK